MLIGIVSTAFSVHHLKMIKAAYKGLGSEHAQLNASLPHTGSDEGHNSNKASEKKNSHNSGASHYRHHMHLRS